MAKYSYKGTDIANLVNIDNNYNSFIKTTLVTNTLSTFPNGATCMAITNDGKRCLVGTYNNNTNSGIYMSTYTTTWNAFIKIISDFGSVYAISMVPDGSRIVFAIDFGGVYYADWNNTNAYNTPIRLDSSSYGSLPRYGGIDITSDGKKIVYTVFDENGAVGLLEKIYYTTWNSTTSSFNTSIVTEFTGGFGITCSSDGNRIVQGYNYIGGEYWSGIWNNTTNVYENFTRIYIPTATRACKFNSDASVVYMVDTQNTNIYYAVWNSTTSTYDNVTPLVDISNTNNITGLTIFNNMLYAITWKGGGVQSDVNIYNISGYYNFPGATTTENWNGARPYELLGFKLNGTDLATNRTAAFTDFVGDRPDITPILISESTIKNKVFYTYVGANGAANARLDPITTTTNGLSISFWVYSNTSSVNGTILEMYYSTTEKITIQTYQNSIEFILNKTDVTGKRNYISLSTNVWTHFVWNFSTASPYTWTIYKNSVITSVSIIGTYNFPNAFVYTVTVGCNNSFSVSPFNGSVANIRVYSAVLSTTDINTLYSLNPTTKIKPVTTLSSFAPSYTTHLNVITIGGGGGGGGASSYTSNGNVYQTPYGGGGGGAGGIKYATDLTYNSTNSNIYVGYSGYSGYKSVAGGYGFDASNGGQSYLSDSANPNYATNTLSNGGNGGNAGTNTAGSAGTGGTGGTGGVGNGSAGVAGNIGSAGTGGTGGTISIYPNISNTYGNGGAGGAPGYGGARGASGTDGNPGLVRVYYIKKS